MKKKYIVIIIAIITLPILVILSLYLITKFPEEDSTNMEDKDSTEEESSPDSHTTKDSDQIVRLIFIHHSTGENWLADDNGALGLSLMEAGYFVSDTNYGWGPDSIGDLTDIGHWFLWFRGPSSETYMDAVYSEEEQHSEYSRLEESPIGENEIIMFKSCFPNSALMGEPSDKVPDTDSNPLAGEGSDSQYHTIGNAKGIYIDLLNYFETRQDKLFIVVSAPPLSDPSYASNARAFNNWLVNNWLDEYPYKNVVVFDFYDILTKKGSSDTLEYPSGEGDDHPNREGNLEATNEFIPFLNQAYSEWKNEK